MLDDSLLPFSFPSVSGEKVVAAFDGGRIGSDGGVLLLAMADRRLGIADRLARRFPDRRDPTRVTHTLADMIRARILAIARGPVFAADAVAVGERAVAEGRDSTDLRARRSMDGVISARAGLGRARHR